MIYYQRIESPLGELLLTSEGRSLTGLYLPGQRYLPQQTSDWQAATLDLFEQAQVELSEYFAQQRRQFNVPIAPQGTDFQKQVWYFLQKIPLGETISYGSLARQIGQPTASRAVGAANGRNPISIIVPCHRVIASNGTLTGYAGGLDRKQWLLQHERSMSEKVTQQTLALFP